MTEQLPTTERQDEQGFIPPMPATTLPPANVATSGMYHSNAERLAMLRDEQHTCDDQVAYWSSRSSDLAIAIAATLAERDALTNTSVVTRRVPAKPVRKRAATTKDQANART